MEVAKRLKERIREETSLTASAGVAPNKFLAKIASSWKKPDGLTVIAPERIEAFLQKLPVDALWGVGPKTAARLRARGIERLVDVRSADASVLAATVGGYAEALRRMSYGQDDRAVDPNRERKSIGCEETFVHDLTDAGEIQSRVEALARNAAGYLVRKKLRARTVTLKLRYSNFETITRSETRDPAADAPNEISTRAGALLEKTEAGKRPVRLLGVSLHGLTEAGDATLDEDRPETGLPFPEGSGAEPTNSAG